MNKEKAALMDLHSENVRLTVTTFITLTKGRSYM